MQRSNQNSIKSAIHGKAAANVKLRAQLVVEDLNGDAGRASVPVQVFLAPQKDAYRKPDTGMWDFMVASCNGGVQPGARAAQAGGRPGLGVWWCVVRARCCLSLPSRALFHSF